MSEALQPVTKGNVEDIIIDVYDLSGVVPAEGSEFIPGFYYDIVAEEDPLATSGPVKAEQVVRLAGPYASSQEALAAGKAFVNSAINPMDIEEANVLNVSDEEFEFEDDPAEPDPQGLSEELV